MIAEVNKWVLDNLYEIPLFFVILIIALYQERRRIDRRIDAVIDLLKQRGIDIYHYEPRDSLDD